MGFNILTVREASDNGDATFFPIASSEGSRYLLDTEAGEASDVVIVQAKGATVSEVDFGHSRALRRVASVSDTDVEVYITENRVMVACEKYMKGGGWIGFGTGLLVASAANLVSHARQAYARRGKILVGHIRYPWLRAIGYTQKTSLTSTNVLRLIVRESTTLGPRDVYLDLILKAREDPPEVARYVTQMCARHRLLHEHPTEHGHQFGQLMRNTALPQIPGKFATTDMPHYLLVDAASAHLPLLPGSGANIARPLPPTRRASRFAVGPGSPQATGPSLKLGAVLLEANPGVLIQSISPDSAAERAGLMVGDIIEEVDGNLVTTVAETLVALRQLATVELPITIDRGGRTHGLRMRFDRPTESSGPLRLGAMLYDTDAGVIIGDVPLDSPAYVNGLRSRDLVRAVADQAIGRAVEVVTVIARVNDQAGTLPLTVRRGGELGAANLPVALS